MTYLNTLKIFPFPGPFLLCQFVCRGNEFFPATVLPFYRSTAYLWSQVGSKKRFEEHSCLLHCFFSLCTCFLPGTNLHDGLWHSVNINARRHRITLTLDNNAATASHATTVSRIYSGNSYYFGGRLFQRGFHDAGPQLLTTEFSPCVFFAAKNKSKDWFLNCSAFSTVGRLKSVGQAWQRESKQNFKDSCKSGLLVVVANGCLHLSDTICKICKAVLPMSGFGFS